MGSWHRIISDDDLHWLKTCLANDKPLALEGLSKDELIRALFEALLKEKDLKERAIGAIYDAVSAKDELSNFLDEYHKEHEA